MSARKRFFADRAFLPEGWTADVLIEADEAGVIAKVSPRVPRPSGAEHLPGYVLPGLPNLHSHTFQRAMAGLAELRGPQADSFWSWRDVMYRFVGKLTPDDVEAIAAMAMVEMLEGGFTSLAEFHYLHHDPAGRPYADPAEMAGRIVAAAARTGIGLTLLPVFYRHGGFGRAAAGPGQRRFLNDLDGYLLLHEASARAVKALPGAVVGVAPHSLRAAAPEEIEALVTGLRHGPVHIHIAEQEKEVADCLAWSGRRPVEWLTSNAEIGPRWTLIHATHLVNSEIRAIAAAGAVVGLCPITEANLGDGLFEGVAFQAAGGRFGVGSDSNVEITAAGELRMLEYGQRLKHRGRNMLAVAESGSTGEALYRATLSGGAQALMQPVGAIAAGMRADFVRLDAGHPAFACAGEQPLDIYVFSGARVIDDVFVGASRVVSGGRHVERERIARRYRDAIARHREA